MVNDDDIPHFPDCPANPHWEDDPQGPGPCECRDIAEDIAAEMAHDRMKEEGW